MPLFINTSGKYMSDTLVRTFSHTTIVTVLISGSMRYMKCKCNCQNV